MRRTGVCVSVFRNSVILEILWILAAIPVCRNDTGRPVLARVSHFYLGSGILVGFVNNSSDVSEAYGSPCSCLSTLSLGGWSEQSISVEDVMGGEVDELEEALGWPMSCLKGVMGVEEGKLEEELVDKPRNTIGTNFSVLHCIQIPFLMRCGFWPLIDSYEYPCSSQSFPSDKNWWRILEDFQSQEYIQFFDINCGLFMRLHFTIGCCYRRRTSRCRHGFQFNGIQILFANLVHRRSGAYNKFSFLRFKGWWRT